MRKHDIFQKQIHECLDKIPYGSINTNETLLRVIAQELAVIVDGIGKIANIEYTQEEGMSSMRKGFGGAYNNTREELSKALQHD